MGIGIVVDARFPKGGARSSEEAGDGIGTDTLALSVSERQAFCSLPEAAPSESGEENILALPLAYQQYSLRPELIWMRFKVGVLGPAALRKSSRRG
jgi:hypothetical protein